VSESERGGKWSRWAADRKPVENTPRRDQQIRDREALWELDADIKRRGSS
jgi:hypothetical protein